MSSLLSFALVKWPFAYLVQLTRIAVALLERAPGDYGSFIISYEESAFAESHLVRDEHGEEQTFRCYYAMLLARTSQEERDERALVQEMRACFLAGVLCDPRLRRLLLAPHIIHEKLGTQPTNTQTFQVFAAKMRGDVEAFLDEKLSLADLLREGSEVWQSEYIFHDV